MVEVGDPYCFKVGLQCSFIVTLHVHFIVSMPDLNISLQPGGSHFDHFLEIVDGILSLSILDLDSS